jgi:Tol biopolymer transport system component
VSTNFAGLAGSFTFVPASTAPAMDTNGELVLFLSNVSNEPGTQPDGRFRLYVRDLSTSAITSFPTNPAGAVVSDIVPVLSPDGTLVAWETAADNLVADDLNDAFDVFVRHLATGETTLVSARHPSRPANTGRGLASVTAGALNANGSRIAFLSGDATLAANDTNRLSDAFLRDFVAGASLPLSAAPFPVMNSPSMPLAQYFPTNSVLNVQLDASGQRALFSGRWTASGSSNHTLVWRDLATGTNLQVAVGPSTPRAVLSPDGRFVFFDTADQVGFLGVPAIGDNFFTLDVLMWNSALTVHDQGSRLSVLSSTRFGTTGNGPSILPLVSPDGCQVAFLSRASDLTLDSAGSTNFQVLARDQFCHPTNYLNGVNRLISYRTVASGAPNGRSFDQPWPTGATNPVFTADSRYLFFQDGASNVIYRHDLLNEFVTRITNVTNNLFATNIARVTNVTVCTDCRSPSVSADGRFLAYEMPGAAGAVNILVKDLATGTTQPVSLNFAGAGFGNGPSYAPLLTHDARFVVFTSKASDLVTGDNNRVADVFLRDLRAGVTFCLSRSAAGNGTGNRVSSNPVLSADGRTIAFQSFASDLVDGDYNDTRDVFVVSLAGPDTDGDSLDDDWEVTYFNDLSRDGSGDFDGDGASDLEEFRAGTDPTNTGSVLRVLQLTRARAGNANNEFFYAVTLLWPTTPGRTYRVQFKETIESPWTDLPGDVTAAGVTGQKLHTPIPSPSQSFYRVALLAP